MNKTELVSAIGKESGLGYDASLKVLDALTKVVTEQVAAKEQVQIPGFGKFHHTTTAARTGRNPGTGETINIPAKTKPKFTPADNFNTAVLKANK